LDEYLPAAMYLSPAPVVRTKQSHQVLKCLQCFTLFLYSFPLRAALPSVNAKHN